VNTFSPLSVLQDNVATTGPPTIQTEWDGIANFSFTSTLAYLIRFPDLNMDPQCSPPVGKSFKHPDSDVRYAFRVFPFSSHGPFTEPFADNLSALQALITALNDLDSLCETIEDAYDTSLKNDQIERWDEKS
jgi:hypothetical protein